MIIKDVRFMPKGWPKTKSFVEISANEGFEKIEFNSKEELKSFLIEHWSSIEISQPLRLSYWWRDVLSGVFGNEDWDLGIDDDSYGSNEGSMPSFSGTHQWPEYGIEVFGISSSGDAWAGFGGGIYFRILQKS